MKKLLCLMSGAMLFLSLNAQKFEIKPLKVGDRVPDLVFHNIVNYKSTSARLSDYKGRMVIFDFWATWCSSCVGAFPHGQELQRQFGDSIIVMLVNSKGTGDSYDKIVSMFKKQSRIDLPSITGDSILTQLFPHRGIPHYAWVYNGIVKAITSTKDVTAENIRLLMSNPTARLDTKNDFPDFNIKGALFTEKEVLGDIIEHSVLTKYNGNFQSTGAGRLLDDKGDLKCLYYTNIRLVNLYARAYPDLLKYGYNRLIKESPLLDSVYCYDLWLPSTNKEAFLQRMREDLYRAFHFVVKEEVRSTRCLVLSKRGNTNALFDTSMATSATLNEFYDNRYMHNMFMRIFWMALNDKSPIPVFDETGITSKVTIEHLPYNLLDIAALKKALAPYGLDINYETRQLKMSVIKKDDDFDPSNN